MLTWSDPPDATRGRSANRFLGEAELLRKNPGRWAIIVTMPADDKVVAKRTTAVAGNINRGQYAAFPRGEFEAVSRRLNNAIHVYARFISPTEEKEVHA